MAIVQSWAGQRRQVDLFKSYRQNQTGAGGRPAGVTRDRNYVRASFDEKDLHPGGYPAGSSARTIRSSPAHQGTDFPGAGGSRPLLLVADGKKPACIPRTPSWRIWCEGASKPTFFRREQDRRPGKKLRAADEFYALGIERIYPISAAHGFGVGDLLSELVESLFPLSRRRRARRRFAGGSCASPSSGRPNVGNPRLVNRILALRA